MTNLAPPYTTGAGGPDFERRVATAFVCSSIAGASIPPLVDIPNCVWLQAGHLGCNLEDIVLATDQASPSMRRCFCSVKSAVVPTKGDTEFYETISRAWEDWTDSKVFNKRTDRFALIVSTSRSPRNGDFQRLTEISRAAANHSDFNNRLSIDRYHRKSIRDVLHQVSAIVQDSFQIVPSDENLFSFLRSFYGVSFDFDSDNSQDKERVIGILRLAGINRDGEKALDCWNAVFEKVSHGEGNAKVFDGEAIRELSSQFDIEAPVAASARKWLKRVREHCQLTREGICSTAGDVHLEREDLREELDDLVRNKRIILVTGSPGSGKSSIVAETLDSVFGKHNVYCFESEEFAHPHLDIALSAAGLSDLAPSEWADALPFDDRVIFIDAIERVLQSAANYAAIDQLLRLASRDRRWRIVVTCRDYYFRHTITRWELDWHPMKVPLLTSDEVSEIHQRSPFPDVWLHSREIMEALRNLKWADLALRTIRIANITTKSTIENWSTIREWRENIWRHLVQPEENPEAQELLLRICLKRLDSNELWNAVETESLSHAQFLFKNGILQKEAADSNRFKTEHDLIDDWALVTCVKRAFNEHKSQPIEFFQNLSNHLLMQRAFRQFFSELLESSSSEEGVAFLKKVLAVFELPQHWNLNVIVGLVGSRNSNEILKEIESDWAGGVEKLLADLHHTLRTAYIGFSTDDGQTQVPVGSGWQSVFEFLSSHDEIFIQKNLKIVFGILCDWHIAVQRSEPNPEGIVEAAQVVQMVWKIAIASEERFERLVSDERFSFYTDFSKNPFYSIIAAVAEQLGSEFFNDLCRTLRRDKDKTESSRKYRISRELVEFLTTDHRGWKLARAYPTTMVRLCVQMYGIGKREEPLPFSYRSSTFNSSIRINDDDFSPPSAYRGPFLELLRTSPKIGISLIQRLIELDAEQWISSGETRGFYDTPIEIEITIGDKSARQVGDQGWWRCYRGWSPCHTAIECGLMALEKWLIDDVGNSESESLPEVLSELILSSDNIAVTAVAASVSHVYWWKCGEVAAGLLGCWHLMALDRHRWSQDQTNGGWNAWSDVEDIYLDERRGSNNLEHRKVHLEQLFIQCQFGPDRELLWAVIDGYLGELANLEPDDDILTARAVLHRIDSRNLVAKPISDEDNRVFLHPKPPPKDVEEFLEESSEEHFRKMSFFEVSNWANAILEPMNAVVADWNEWPKMLEVARSLGSDELGEEGRFLHGETPVLVAAVCILKAWNDLDNESQLWCLHQCTDSLYEMRSITSYGDVNPFSTWRLERASARACASLLGRAHDQIVAEKFSEVMDAVSIALTAPDKLIRYCAADSIGSGQCEAEIAISAACLLVRSARVIRDVEMHYRGPKRDENDGLETWNDRSEAMHQEILARTTKLREEFVCIESIDVQFLNRYSPRGFEEEERLSSLIACSRSGSSQIQRSLVSRILKWAYIENVHEGRRKPGRRLFGRDTWREHDMPMRHNNLTIGEVQRELARYAFHLGEDEIEAFYSDILTSENVIHLGLKSGEFLKDSCLQLDLSGTKEAFWKVWRSHSITAIQLASSNRRDKQSVKALIGLISALFLNDMYFKEDQDWPPVHQQLHHFPKLFSCFPFIAVEPYIRFLNTVGRKLLPSEWVSISKAICQGREKTGLQVIHSNCQSILIRLIRRDIIEHRISKGDVECWDAIRNLLGILVEESHFEAFLLREQIARLD